MSEPSNDPAVLLARAAKLKLFVMLRRTVLGAALPGKLGEHLRWMIGREKEGKIFLSGPIAPHEGAAPLDGLTILRAESRAEAQALAEEDPFVKAGIVAFELREWTVNEGAIPVMITLSDSAAAIR